MSKKILHLPLKAIYFNQIKSGIKTEEYREITEYWAKRLVNRDYDEVHLKLGYPKKDDLSKILIKPWKGYVVKTIEHPHFGNKELSVFAILVD